ncbi:hypothetical protein AJ79_02044 [Helicocarpus griseus UAMH5409]|uniref:Uncharacterized protein n=1 Tax=Helicocarpus griseus UAMH5409 TaxID=1447875 RepID=A0A2B7XWB1_9EURO|nr:hypothetical protein AJ79_02044 [Helicocarpus griseus UAMH5409]
MALSIQEQITTICENIDDGLRAIMTADVSMFERYPMFFRKLGRVLVDVRGAAERWDGGER